MLKRSNVVRDVDLGGREYEATESANKKAKRDY